MLHRFPFYLYFNRLFITVGYHSFLEITYYLQSKDYFYRRYWHHTVDIIHKVFNGIDQQQSNFVFSVYPVKDNLRKTPWLKVFSMRYVLSLYW